MPDDLWDVISDPTEHWTFFIVLVCGVAMVAVLAWVSLWPAYVRARDGSATRVDPSAIASGGGGESVQTRLSNLERLHKEGRITAEKLAELKAAVQAEVEG